MLGTEFPAIGETALVSVAEPLTIGVADFAGSAETEFELGVGADVAAMPVERLASKSLAC